MLNDSFNQFMIESYLTGSSICGGLTALRKCTPHDKGGFYSCFFQLSIGIERLFKIVFILNHMNENDLNKPDFATLKKFSHNIYELHKHCSSYGLNHLPNFEWQLNWQQDLILKMLSEFAESSRYFNLNKIVKSKKESTDPLVLWNEILNSCFRKHITDIRKTKLENDLNLWAEKNNAYGYTWNKGLHGYILSQIDEYILTWKVNNVSSYIAYEIIDMLQPFYHLISTLKDNIDNIELSKGIKEPLVPYIHEILVFLLVPKKIALSRKKWSIRY
ncbi:hypothetical protein ACLEVB_04720 [Enterobacter ludwigii]|uniref:hypothetical protein n=1 Tax=Enterobacter ludwigii TaxID=299767 RepID=UPI003975A741